MDDLFQLNKGNNLNRIKLIFLLGILTFVSIELCFSQEYFEKKYPSYGGGITFGYSYYFPNDLNDYIDLTHSSAKKDHINSGINVGLFLTYGPNRYLEFVPEFNYIYSKHSFKFTNLNLAVNCRHFGGTLFYIKLLRPGINLRFGGGLASYHGNIDWEYPASVQTWKGSTIGFHGATGGEFILNPNMSVSILFVGRIAKISKLKDKQGNILPSITNNGNLKLNFSGIEIKFLLIYYL